MEDSKSSEPEESMLAVGDAGENVVPFPGTRYINLGGSIEVKAVLDAAKHVESVIVVGIAPGGELYVASNEGDVLRDVGLLMRAVRFLSEI